MTNRQAGLTARFDALRNAHAELKLKIRREQNRTLPDAMNMQRLKREKLHIKDEMSRIAGVTATVSRIPDRRAA